jgi:hypothetical protein
MSYKLKAALLLPLLLAACDEPAGPTAAPVDFMYDIQREQTEPAFVVREADGEVSVRGNFPTPCVYYGARAEAERSGGTLKVRVIGMHHGLCFAALGSYGYQATLREVPAGEYRLRVEHVYPESDRSTTVALDARVRVR